MISYLSLWIPGTLNRVSRLYSSAQAALLAALMLVAPISQAVSTVSIVRSQQEGNIHIFSINFSRDVEGLERQDLVTNGIIDALGGGGASYTARIRHTNPAESIFLSIYRDVVTDSNGEGNFAATRIYPPTNLLSISPETGVVLGLTPRAGDGLPLENQLQAAVFPIAYAYPVADRPYPMRVTFDRAVGGFNADNIKVNGELRRFSGVGSEYFFEVIPSAESNRLRVSLEFDDSGNNVQLDAISIPILMRDDRLNRLDSVLADLEGREQPTGPVDELGRSDGNPVQLPPQADPDAADAQPVSPEIAASIFSDEAYEAIAQTDPIGLGDDFISSEAIALARRLSERELRLQANKEETARAAEAIRLAELERQQRSFLHNFRALAGAGIASGGDQLISSAGDVTVDFKANTGTQFFGGGQYYLPTFEDFSIRAAYEYTNAESAGDFGTILERSDFTGGFMYDYRPWKMQVGADLIYSIPSVQYAAGITESSDFIYTSDMENAVGFRFHAGILPIPQLKVEFRLIAALEYNAIATRGGSSNDQQTSSVSASGFALLFSGVIGLKGND